ncbi:AAA family ATPase, partial [Tenacibaculum finnmarkense]
MIGILANQKGGVAKTINTLHLGSALAQKGYSVLLIDSDPQCDLTHSLGIKEVTYNIIDFLENKPNMNFREKAENFFILPGA